MRPKLSPDFPSTRILIFMICCGVFLLVLGISNIQNVREGLTTGRVYSVGIIWDIKTVIYKDASPGAYWAMIGLYVASCVGSIGLGAWAPIFHIIAYKKKLVRQKRERSNL
jgi:hypothetical protein